MHKVSETWFETGCKNNTRNHYPHGSVHDCFGRNNRKGFLKILFNSDKQRFAHDSTGPLSGCNSKLNVIWNYFARKAFPFVLCALYVVQLRVLCISCIVFTDSNTTTLSIYVLCNTVKVRIADRSRFIRWNILLCVTDRGH